jgi:hypothetical protein
VRSSHLTISVIVACISLLSIDVALAGNQGGNFAQRHPRRAQVNKREQRQQNRIANGIKSGKLTPAEAAQLEKQEAAIKAQERSEVKANGGHLTKDQQKQLNQELNQQSKEIYKDKHN